MNVRSSVLDRYSQGAAEREDALCCAVDYQAELLRLLPQEVVDKDYGCGDPSRYVRAGDTVLDLGSGSGKICYMAAQIVGDAGRVIGVDMNDDMLALARKYSGEMARKLGGDRVVFHKGHIQDLALDVDAMAAYLAANPVHDAQTLESFEAWRECQRSERPLIADASVDVVVSNCVLNLVDDAQKGQLVREIFRVLRPGGRLAISDIVADEVIPQALKEDATLWSGCISGAFEEREFIESFAAAGFVGLTLDKWASEPWRVIEGIEFRSVTLTAVKPESGARLDCGQAVIYRGPYREVCDDEGHVFPRGERMAVCERTYRLLTEGLYGEDFIAITPAAPREPQTWCTPPGTRRPAAETKGAAHQGGPSRSSGCCG